MEKLEKDETTKKFIQELTKTLENFNNQNENKKKELNQGVKLTDEEELEFHKAKSDFLQNYFKEELSKKHKGEIFIVTNKYENDYEYHRYKVAQYKNNKEYKFIVFEKELPHNIKINDVVRKKDGQYIYDEEATKYVEYSINKLKQDIIDKR